jgi:DNA repair exonuclease SbcCD ATPase subunit
MRNDMNSTTKNTESITISRAEYDSMKQEIEQLGSINNWLREQLENLKKNHFGSKRETASDEVIGQMMLFDEPEVYAYLEEITNRRTAVAEHERILKKERVFLLDKLPPNAEVQVEVHELNEEERKCPVCGSKMEEIGKEVVRSLEIILSCTGTHLFPCFKHPDS